LAKTAAIITRVVGFEAARVDAEAHSRLRVDDLMAAGGAIALTIGWFFSSHFIQNNGVENVLDKVISCWRSRPKRNFPHKQ
jgi:hypothetical protein